MTGTQTERPKLQGKEKLAVELGPVVVFMLAYFMPTRIGPLVDSITGGDFFSQEGNELFLALALFMPVFALSFIYSVSKERRVAPMLLVTGVLVMVLGSLTLILQDKVFFYIKLTITYGFFATVLGGGLLFGQNYLKTLFDGAFELPDHAWRTLTWRFVGFFTVIAVANEIIWRVLIAMGNEGIYITLKMIGVPVIYLAFMLLQAPLLSKYLQDEKENGEKKADPINETNTDNLTTTAIGNISEKPDADSKKPATGLPQD